MPSDLTLACIILATPYSRSTSLPGQTIKLRLLLLFFLNWENSFPDFLEYINIIWEQLFRLKYFNVTRGKGVHGQQANVNTAPRQEKKNPTEQPGLHYKHGANELM